MRPVRVFGFAAWLLVSLAGTTLAAEATYSAKIDKWRQEFDADILKDGYLTLTNRVQVGEGHSTVGSDPASTLVLPDRAPRHVGSILRRGSRVQFDPAPGVRCTVDGKPVTGRVELSTKPGTGRVRVGAIRVGVRAIGADYYAMVTDDENPAIAKFRGTSWFPIDASWRISARFIPYAQPESVEVPMTRITSKTTMRSTGEVAFELAGHPVRLKTFLDEDHLFVMFADATNGHETYGGGRFLTAPLPKAGTTTLDFNKAFNPYCSVNDYVVCPVVPAANRLGTRVAAGEKYIHSD